VVCGTCHGREGELFAKSKVSQTLELEGKRGCVTCHSNHDVQVPSDAMISAGPEGVCGRCHAAGSPGAKAAAVIVPRFQALKSRLAEADSLLSVAERRGMETSAGRELLKQSEDQIVNLRAVLHSFDLAPIQAVMAEGSGLADRAQREGLLALRDWRNRRIGMALSLGVILLLMAGLILKIRRMESP
jgi:predicted CXXCH cytochrome family protein